MTGPESTGIPRGQVAWIAQLALVAALGIGVIYIPQPIQPLVAAEFALPLDSAAGGVIATQLGYAVGVFLLVALGDRVRPRLQVGAHLITTAVALTVAAVAPWNELFVIACFVAGAGATYGQLLVPVALRAVPASQRAVTTAVLVGSFLVGLFTVRTGLGALAGVLGWRATLLVCAAVLLACLLLLRVVPSTVPTDPPSYLRLIASLPGVVRRSPTLRLMTAMHASVFAAFTTVWASITVFAVADLDLSVAQASLLGLAGLAGGATTVALAPILSRLTMSVGLVITLGSAFTGTALLALGSGSAVVTVAGLYLVSAGMSGSQVFTQARALQSVPSTESGRANTVFVTGTFVASSTAIAVAAVLQRSTGFPAVAWMAVVLVLTAATLAVVARRRGLF